MAGVSVSNGPSVIGPDTSVRGTLAGDEDLVIEGRVEGTVNIAADVVIALRGVVEASVEAESITVHGQVFGDLVATRGISVEKTARIQGSLTAPRIVISEGAYVRGSIDMDVELPDALAKSLPR